MKFDKQIHIGKARISDHDPVYIIAEAGVNHGGDIEVAKKLVDIAVSAKVDAVKFQAFRTSHLIVEGTEKAPYQKQTTDKKETQADMLRGLELRYEHYKELKDYCDERKIQFLITPFDEVSLQELEKLGVEAYKIASTDTSNLPFLRKVAETGKPIILSTGMSDPAEVRAAVEELGTMNTKLILLQCTANYPIIDEEANLAVITTFKKEFDCIVGYSDHSEGIGAAPFAVPLGAKVLEKHFTLSKEEEGPDHRASLSPQELVDFVKLVRRVEKFIGNPTKEITASEKRTKTSLQKCLVASREIKEGESFSLENIIGKRTGGKGISPIRYRDVIGKKATKNYLLNEIIRID